MPREIRISVPNLAGAKAAAEAMKARADEAHIAAGGAMNRHRSRSSRSD